MKQGKEEPMDKIMTVSPVALKPDDSFQLASDLISLGRLGRIAIVDSTALGIISEPDLIGQTADRILASMRRRSPILLEEVMVTTTDSLRYVEGLGDSSATRTRERYWEEEATTWVAS